MSILDSTPPSASQAEDRSAYRAVTLFPVLVLVAGILGYVFAGPISGGAGLITPLLGVIMFGMGLTLTLPDFALVLRRPLPVLLGVGAQYVVMPLVGLLVVTVLRLPDEIAAGVILVGCVPGGTASNVVAYLARADTALSVTMTSVSTLLAPVLTPLLTLWLVGERLPVDGWGMARTIVVIVLVPVVLGLLVRLLLPRLVRRVLPAMPWFSVLVICVVVAIVVSLSADRLVEAGLLVTAAVILHNLLGLGIGYGIGRVTGVGERSARTMAIEVGMQNSGLASGLAATFFTPVAALPGAVFSVWHNLSGATLAGWFRRRDARAAAQPRA
ncbi:bile acid:sodium symporter family protein [Serinicoccus hydrothermalis]|uniref:bile acid:sodium symporter family protein n=1 Tax=Serinicoccus hydrothermalis TaxID=1758689 RepID=UPI00082A7049|nr:bile acid:sodium symporter family protein [Serinicoccus hydrothermalis]